MGLRHGGKYSRPHEGYASPVTTGLMLALYRTMNMTYYMVMIVVNTHEAKARLSEYLEAAAGGERVLICKRNQPVAELRPVAAARTELRPVGGAKGRLVVPDAFFEPLPADVLDGFEGTSGKHPGVARGRAGAAARPPATYRTTGVRRPRRRS
jgi:prevent-host-death family protein